MKYETQKIALAYFSVALALFLIQIIGGLLVGWVYVSPNFLSELVPFSTLRMLHTNSLIVWLLLGFFGAAYFLIPEEAEREIHSPKLAYLQLIILVVGTLGVVVTYLFNLFEGHWLLGKEGREFIEQPVWVKIGIVVAALIFLYNVSMTVLQGRKTAISNILLLGLWGLALLFLFAFYNPDNLAVDKQYWWYIVHLWVEGVWVLIMASILAYLMLKLTGVDREVVEKWLYVIVAAALFSGILGTGHHYYWIGTPGYWQWIGSVFSSLEVIPFFAMMAFAFVMVWKGRRDHPNKAALCGRWAAPRLPSSAQASGVSCTRCTGSTTTPTARRSPRRTGTSPSTAPMSASTSRSSPTRCPSCGVAIPITRCSTWQRSGSCRAVWSS